MRNVCSWVWRWLSELPRRHCSSWRCWDCQQWIQRQKESVSSSLSSEFKFKACIYLCRTMVAITQKQRLMGTSARNQAVTNFKNTIWGFTPFLGRKFSDPIVQEEMKRVPYQVIERPGNEIGIKVRVLKMYIYEHSLSRAILNVLLVCCEIMYILRLFKITALDAVE